MLAVLCVLIIGSFFSKKSSLYFQHQISLQHLQFETTAHSAKGDLCDEFKLPNIAKKFDVENKRPFLSRKSYL